MSCLVMRLVWLILKKQLFLLQLFELLKRKKNPKK